MELTEKVLRKIIKEELISLTEAKKYEVHYSDGIRGSEEFKKEADAIAKIEMMQDKLLDLG